jgi:hypothetical protein
MVADRHVGDTRSCSDHPRSRRISDQQRLPRYALSIQPSGQWYCCDQNGTVQIRVATMGCSSGNTSDVAAGLGLSSGVRAAVVTALNGFHSAKVCNAWAFPR